IPSIILSPSIFKISNRLTFSEMKIGSISSDVDKKTAITVPIVTSFPEYRLALLHGQMKASEKEIVLDKFAKGEIDILVATTIIEEGIDVANATVMYVEDAKMFGLSQLHQLRGRLARGNCESFMFLQSSNLQTLDDNSMERLEFFAGCDDGFELSKFDLRQRHEGNILGLAQSGKSICKLLSTSDNVKMIECARECAQELIKRRKNGSDEDKRELETLFYEAQHLMI
ncbi:MAG: hypothetical protein MJ189_05075, partial [Coriobacteriales bacterium]|nr:hypothetical protein [Coriobacteriales bacterium]